MNVTVCNDNDFGPITKNCRSNFDFTLLFEDTILAIVPSILVLIFAVSRIFYLFRKPKLLWERRFQLSKVIALLFYAALQTGLIALWAVQPGLRSWSSILAATLSLLNAFVFCYLSYLEHARSIRPSTTLIVYLLCSTAFDIVRDRTLWLVAPKSSLTQLFTASVVFKALVLVLESGEKARYLPAEFKEKRPEETSSILNRGVFYWLNQLMVRGARSILLPNDLYELQPYMTADELTPSFAAHWQRANKTSKHAILLTTAKTLQGRLLIVVFPRVALLVLTLCQPLIVRELLTYLATPAETRTKDVGYGLIAAFPLVFAGIAISNGFYSYLHYQFLIMVRGCMVGVISWQTARLNIQSVKDPKAAVTLMSTDVERILDGLQSLHEFWASMIQIAIALYLLQQQMGVASVMPIIISILSAFGTTLLGKASNRKQVSWMEAVQNRISLISALLSSIKGVKMRGLMDVLGDKIQAARVNEIEKGNGWRRVLLVTVGFSFVPEYISPVFTFLIYIIQARASGGIFDAARAFTTLSLLVIMTQPMNKMIQSFTPFLGAIGCFQRIGEFLSSEEQKDFRDIEGYDIDRSEFQTLSQALSDHTPPIELTSIRQRPLSNRPAKGQPIIRISDGWFGWAIGEDALQDINVTIPSGRLTCIVGPVACGKSTLCKTMLGETRASKGSVELFASSREIAYCDQTAHLISGTIKENIVGFSEADDAWYDTVLQACALWEDVSALPNKHDTLVGSSGVNLSGGQRQKVALARAVYARKAILILDDIFSGFDAGSEQHVFRHVIGPEGLAQMQGMTIIFATHAIKFLPYTDHIIALDSEGKISQEGSYLELRNKPGYIRTLSIDAGPQGHGTSSEILPPEIENIKVAEKEAEQDLTRQAGDFSIYRYYQNAAGLRPSIVLLISVVATSICFNLSTYWIKLWTDISSQTGRHNDYMYLGVYGVLQLLTFIFLQFYIYQLLIVMVTKTGIELHRRALKAVCDASLVLFSTTDSGTITNRFSQDIQLIDSQLPMGLLNLLFSAALIVGQIILIIVSSPWVGLAFPFIFAIFYVVQNFYLKTSRQLRFMDLEAKSPLYTNFLETLSGLSTIRAFGWTEKNLAHNRKLLDLSQRPAYLLYMIQRWLTFVLDMIVAFLATIIAALAVTQKAGGGSAGVALTQVMLINMTLKSIIFAWVDVETSIGAVSRIKSFSEGTPSEHRVIEAEQPAADWPYDGRVELKDFTAIYETAPDAPALDKLNLIIEAGEKIGVCGRSGSGKSSLVLAVFRMLEIKSGSLKIDGLDLQRIPRTTIRERINVIPQEPLFLPGTVRENLDPRQEFTNHVLIEALKRVNLWSVFEVKDGLDEEIRNDLLSHGQRQLFCLAAAILRKTKIVVLDEATSNVDHETDETMQRIIREEFKGCTIIAVAHRLNTIMDFDRVAVLDHGVLCELDSPQALLARDSRFKSMWGERKSSTSA